MRFIISLFSILTHVKLHESGTLWFTTNTSKGTLQGNNVATKGPMNRPGGRREREEISEMKNNELIFFF